MSGERKRGPKKEQVLGTTRLKVVWKLRAREKQKGRGSIRKSQRAFLRCKNFFEQCKNYIGLCKKYIGHCKKNYLAVESYIGLCKI